MNQQIDQAGIDLIKSFEKCSLTAYQDQKGVWTIGWGHTGSDFDQSSVWTQEHADQVFLQDIAWATKAANDLITDDEWNANQFSAVVSFIFNVGRTNFANSTLDRDLNQGNLADAILQFPRWDRTGGQVSDGLERRRAAELALFQTPC